MNFKKLAATVAIIMVASLIPFGPSSASAAPSKTLTVDDNMVECRNAQYTSIQAAVNAASPGDTIKVCPGTYTEQVTIPASKNGLKLRSERKEEAIIKAPAVMVDPKAIVRVSGATGVNIERFTISGPGGGACDSIRYGVRVDGGGSASILDNHITMIRDMGASGCQNGVAVLVGRNAEATSGTAVIKGNLIDDYQKNGPTVDGPGSYARIEQNTIVGAGPVPYIAQNGVQISRGAMADVNHNNVSGNVYTPSALSTGILLFEVTNGIDVSHNTVSANDWSIAMQTVSQANISHNRVLDSVADGIYSDYGGDGNTISHNMVSGSGGNGIGLYETTNNTVAHNESDNNAMDGIYAWTDSANNHIENNRMDDNGEHDAHDDSVGPNTGGTANFWEHNNCTTDNRGGALCGN